eukprot:Selendium_serpulae@DN573_c0_g1_i1.p2
MSACLPLASLSKISKFSSSRLSMRNLTSRNRELSVFNTTTDHLEIENWDLEIQKCHREIEKCAREIESCLTETSNFIDGDEEDNDDTSSMYTSSAKGSGSRAIRA